MQAQAQIQQDEEQNKAAYYISVLRKEKDRLTRTKNPIGIMDQLNSFKMSIFNQKKYRQIDGIIGKIDNTVIDLGRLIVRTEGSANGKISDKDIKEIIYAADKNEINKIALIIIGLALAAVSLFLIAVTWGIIIPIMASFFSSLSVGIGAIVWGSKSIHDDKKALLETKIEYEIMPTKSEIFFYKKMIKDILLQMKGETEFQKKLYRKIDKEYDLKKKIEEGTPLTQSEKFFHKSKIREILQEKIKNREKLSDYQQRLCEEFNINTNQIVQETGSDNRTSMGNLMANAQNQAANQVPQANETTPLLQSNNQLNSSDSPNI